MECHASADCGRVKMDISDVAATIAEIKVVFLHNTILLKNNRSENIKISYWLFIIICYQEHKLPYQILRETKQTYIEGLEE